MRQPLPALAGPDKFGRCGALALLLLAAWGWAASPAVARDLPAQRELTVAAARPAGEAQVLRAVADEEVMVDPPPVADPARGGVASTPGRQVAAAVAASDAPLAPSPEAVSAAAAAVASAAADAEGPALAAPKLSPAELNVWRSPLFQQRFAESYIAETDIEPQASQPERALMQSVLALMAANQLALAGTTLEQEVAKNRGCSALLDYTLGNIYFQQERLKLATLAYQVAVEKHPKFRRAWKNLGVALVRQNDFPKAVTALTRVVEQGGADATTYGMLGFAYSSLENHLAAESAYRLAILMDPKSLDWPMGLARSFFKQERFPEAVTLLGQMVAANPDRADLWTLQASAYIGMKEPLKAAENYKMVAALGKATADNFFTLGDIYLTEQLYGPAAEAYTSALQKDPEADPARIVRSAKFLSARGALHEAGTLIQRVEELKGTQLDATSHKEMLKIRARIAAADGASQQELSVLEEIVQLDPLDGEALIMLGQSYNRAGDAEKALLYFERAGGIEAFEADAKVRQAQVLVQKGDYEAALPLLRRAQQIKPRENVQDLLEQVQRVAKGR